VSVERGFRLALAAACALVLSSLVVLGFSLHNGSHPATGAPLATLDSPQLLSVASSHGGYDPVLMVDQRGAMRALVTERGGSCVAFGAGLAQAAPIALSAGGGTAPGDIRAAPYCTAAQLPSGALAFAAISPSGVRIVGTLDGSGTVTNGAPLPGPTIVFGAMWLTATPNGVYLAAETEGGSGDCCAITVWHSVDGVTYAPGVTLPQAGDAKLDAATFFGAVAVDASSGESGAAQERLYVPFTHAGDGGTSERQLWLASSADGGTTWTSQRIVEAPTGTTVAAQYPSAAVDAGGTVYVAWSDIGRIWYAWSKDHGASIGGVQPVDAQTALNVMPSIVAGDVGHIAIAWYAGTGSAAMGSNAENDEWRPMMAMSGNANSNQPALARLSLSGITVHRGSVCLLGAGCTDSGDRGPYDPRLGAHLALAVDPLSGGVKVAFASDGGAGGEPGVRVVQLHCGERILVRPPQPLPACGG
jgi:hypothetical protein